MKKILFVSLTTEIRIMKENGNLEHVKELILSGENIDIKSDENFTYFTPDKLFTYAVRNIFIQSISHLKNPYND